MSLRLKLTLAIATLVALYAVCDGLVREHVILPSFGALEQREARRDLARVVHTLHGELEHLDQLAHDWSQWDDTYHYLLDGNGEFEAENLTQEGLENTSLHLIYLVAADGTVRTSYARADEQGRPLLELAEFPSGRLPAGHMLLELTDGAQNRRGFLSTPLGLAFYCARAVLPTDGEGQPSGALLMLRLLDRARVAELVEQTQVQFTLDQLALAPAGDRTLEQRAAQVAAAGDGGLFEVQGELATCSGVLRGADSAPLALVRTELPRTIWSEGRATLGYATVSMLVAALFVLFGTLLLLQRVVVTPLRVLSQHAVRIGEGGQLGQRLAFRRRDELGILADELDAMVERLSESRGRLVRTAHQAGMSEVASEVLHDVGNVLNSAKVSAEQIASRLNSLPLDDVGRVAQLLDQEPPQLARFLSEDPRGRQVPGYLRALGSALASEQKTLSAECRSLGESLEHMRVLVDQQQAHATGIQLRETVVLAEQVELALRISRDARDGEIEFVRSFEALEPLALSKHRLLQILVNLLKNARQAVHAAPAGPKRIELVIVGGAAPRIEVRDSGVGIAPADLTRIFAHGFTTKAEGHGFGLHGSANAAREMGGALRVESAGIGRGACFILELGPQVYTEAA